MLVLVLPIFSSSLVEFSFLRLFILLDFIHGAFPVHVLCLKGPLESQFQAMKSANIMTFIYVIALCHKHHFSNFRTVAPSPAVHFLTDGMHCFMAGVHLCIDAYIGVLCGSGLDQVVFSWLVTYKKPGLCLKVVLD